jgi:hypothetical protein
MSAMASAPMSTEWYVTFSPSTVLLLPSKALFVSELWIGTIVLAQASSRALTAVSSASSASYVRSVTLIPASAVATVVWLIFDVTLDGTNSVPVRLLRLPDSVWVPARSFIHDAATAAAGSSVPVLPAVRPVKASPNVYGTLTDCVQPTLAAPIQVWIVLAMSLPTLVAKLSALIPDRLARKPLATSESKLESPDDWMTEDVLAPQSMRYRPVWPDTVAVSSWAGKQARISAAVIVSPDLLDKVSARSCAASVSDPCASATAAPTSTADPAATVTVFWAALTVTPLPVYALPTSAAV